jgi:ParB-like chromosome segregation protein Spo0J
VNSLNAWLTPEQGDNVNGPVTMIAVTSVSVADSPRMSGENLEHAKLLAASDAELPPIIVHRPTMRVIDGVHRLRAARLRGQENIAVRFFSGNEADAFVLAVQSNIAHGLPLSLADREAAAARIVISHPHWSDRMIASASGLAPRTVAQIRKRHAGESDQEGARLGRDGRIRPTNLAAGRILASDLITENPSLSLRQVAQAAGISPETARDVRNRLRRGEGPVPDSRRAGQTTKGGHPVTPASKDAVREWSSQASAEQRALMMKRLRADPALRFTETGRTLLRLLNVCDMGTEDWEKIVDNIPSHCGGTVESLAKECSKVWADVAQKVGRRSANENLIPRADDKSCRTAASGRRIDVGNVTA